MVEMWINSFAAPRGIEQVARETEEKGWDGLSVVDSQNLSGDPYVALALAARVTERIKLAPAVTNSVTRLAAVTASSIASVDRIADGRASLGIGRGDSALAHLGYAPARVKQFETYLRHLQAYLRGDVVPFDEIQILANTAAPVDALKLADSPKESRIAWLSGGRKVPIEVSASGPRVIEAAARNAERIMFALGADETRLAWGIEIAKNARSKAGLDPEDIRFGAFVNCIPHQDLDTARDLVKGGLTTYARFSVMHGKTQGPVSPAMEKAMQSLHDAYDMHGHTRGDSPQAEALTPEFIDAYAVVGSPEHCIERLKPLVALGLDKLCIGGGLRLTETSAGVEAKALLEEEVIPAMHAIT